jgi:membrane protein YqaA with SNARE-associated domain
MWQVKTDRYVVISISVIAVPTHPTTLLLNAWLMLMVAIVNPTLGNMKGYQLIEKDIALQHIREDATARQKNHKTEDQMKTPVIVAITYSIWLVTSSLPK